MRRSNFLKINVCCPNKRSFGINDTDFYHEYHIKFNDFILTYLTI